MLVLPLAAATILAGCGAGNVVDDQKTQIALRFDLREKTGEKIDSVSCPQDVAVVPGSTFECQVKTASGATALAEIEITDDEADLRVLSLKKP
jgi:hypothetical protein